MAQRLIEKTGKLTPEEQAQLKQNQSLMNQANVPQTNPIPQNVPSTVAAATTPPQIIRDQNTGNVSGVTLQNGQTFLGSSREIQGVASAQAKNQMAPTGTTEASQIALTEQRRQEAEAILQQYKGQQIPQEVLNSLTPPQIDYLTAAFSGVGKAIIPAVGTAISTLPALASAGITAPATFALGATTIASFVAGVRDNIKTQMSQGIMATGGDLNSLKKNMRSAVTDLNTGGNPATAIDLYYQNLNQIKINQAQLRIDAKSFLSTITGEKAVLELDDYELFLSKTLPYLDNELQQAVLNPNPNKILVDSTDFINGS